MSEQRAQEVKPLETQAYADDKYVHLADEFSQIQSCVGMYISQGNTAGALHLFKEIFNNALDECVNVNSPSNRVYVTFIEDLCEFTVTDEGRGVPFELLKDVCTKKHTSTKFVRSSAWTKGQAGRNGVGLTVTAALSDYMSITSYRGNQHRIVEIKDGVILESDIITDKKPNHGLSVKLVPSEKYLGAIDLTTDMVEDYLRRISYLLPQDIKVTLYTAKSAEDKPKAHHYTYQGLSANVEYLSATLEFPPVDLNYSCEDFDLLVSFSYDKTLDDILVNSYCNYIYTTEGGTHELAAQRAICDYFSREAKKLDPSNKFEIIYDDCRKGLIMAINCRHVDPAFEGQHKSKVSNKDVLQEGKRGINDALYQYFGANNALLRKIITYLRQISKIRTEAHKIKGISMKKPTSFLDDAEIGRFMNISDRNYGGYKELIIVEGDSAMGAVSNCRNPKNQALFGIMGVTDNVHGLTPVQILQKETFRNLIKVLGCGIGKDFDISKLKWNKVIICSDADVDGSNITSLILCFFLLFLRPLIDAGKIYKALPPLYIIDKKAIRKHYNGDEWLFDKNELNDILTNMVANNVTVALPETEEGVEVLNKPALRSWMNKNIEYTLELDSLVNRSACNPVVIENVCWFKVLSKGDELWFKQMLESHFPEITYDLNDSSLSGSYDGESVTLITDTLFMKIARRFIKILVENPCVDVWCKNKNDPDDKYEVMTIGTFLDNMSKSFNIRIEQRFKGLGEADPEILFITTMNPKVRRLLRMQIENFQETLDTFELLHGKNATMREKRRDLLENTDISYADIDN